MNLSNKILKSIANKPFRLANSEGVYKITPILSSFCLERDGRFHGSILRWLSTNDKLHIAFNHCGNFIESKIKLSEMTFMTTFNYKTNESIRSSKRA